jgi:hypothetical protein
LRFQRKRVQRSKVQEFNGKKRVAGGAASPAIVFMLRRAAEATTEEDGQGVPCPYKTNMPPFDRLRVFERRALR